MKQGSHHYRPSYRKRCTTMVSPLPFKSRSCRRPTKSSAEGDHFFCCGHEGFARLCIGTTLTRQQPCPQTSMGSIVPEATLGRLSGPKTPRLPASAFALATFMHASHGKDASTPRFGPTHCASRSAQADLPISVGIAPWLLRPGSLVAPGCLRHKRLAKWRRVYLRRAVVQSSAAFLVRVGECLHQCLL